MTVQNNGLLKTCADLPFLLKLYQEGRYQIENELLWLMYQFGKNKSTPKTWKIDAAEKNVYWCRYSTRQIGKTHKNAHL